MCGMLALMIEESYLTRDGASLRLMRPLPINRRVEAGPDDDVQRPASRRGDDDDAADNHDDEEQYRRIVCLQQRVEMRSGDPALEREPEGREVVKRPSKRGRRLESLSK